MKWLIALAVIWLVWRYMPRPGRVRSTARPDPRLPRDEMDALAILDLPPGADAEIDPPGASSPDRAGPSRSRRLGRPDAAGERRARPVAGAS
ncbi:hypothetical protein P0F65_17910 [Sphingomonas sp. I4]